MTVCIVRTISAYRQIESYFHSAPILCSNASVLTTNANILDFKSNIKAVFIFKKYS
jgi:hypothetical protein